VRCLTGPLPGPADPALDLAFAHALLRRVSREELDATIRVYRPAGPAVAFGRRDTNLPGFPAAVATCRMAGFAPVVRASGGRAVAHTTDALVIDHVSPDPLSPNGMEGRFGEFGELFAEVFRGFGVDARVGEVPGEYCPGAHSVNAHGEVKLVGTAQRMVRNAWLFSSVLIFDGAVVLRPLLSRVYDGLGLPFDPASVGALHDEAPGTTLDDVKAAVLDAYSSRFGLDPAEVDGTTLALAREMLDDHRVR
jgi:octanoyl-[GcvH]:protein N-octanoyltransferase